ncbi:hypothetical protein DUNSADRAFT_12014 [Dunaliella salina]|uniref:F-box domain-containing protein n=1 Tax=Dunaliella salina TaxID=3046 RepID=A0ABQ7GC44_DUNSA|nr:hypothetical protein DUNSADRAFT_12014 [Dunaliella salina]|eukprot:KAF5832175.1 hypothetical protein DUNSADRAFT_12014 [Dunaliella salina]
MSETTQSETGWHSLDAHCKAHVLSLLNPKDLCTVAAVSREDLLDASEPLIWQRKLKELFGLSVRGINPATYKALFVGLAQRKIGTSESSCKPGVTYPVRFKALYTDGGVDENLYQQYWCDLAFECNAWGAYCSKVSPNINVLSVIQTPSATEQATLQHRAFLADRCRFAAGRMLARVPLPPMNAPPTRRQVRYYAKAGATLLRWSTSALERLYCALFTSRRSLEPVGRSMVLGLTQATAPGASTPGAEAVEALLSEKYDEILRLRLGSEGAEAVKNSNPAEVLQALSAAYSAAAQAPDTGAAAEQTVEDEKFMAGGSGGGQTGGIDPRNLCEDPHGLKVFDRKLVQKLGKPADLASYTAVMDMIALSRSGNDLFTCPIRTGRAHLCNSASPAHSTQI